MVIERNMFKKLMNESISLILTFVKRGVDLDLTEKVDNQYLLVYHIGQNLAKLLGRKIVSICASISFFNLQKQVNVIVSNN